MSDLTGADKIYIEKILDMGSGYVLDFSDLRFGQFFRRFGVDIHSAQYQIYGTSKANKMRAFGQVPGRGVRVRHPDCTAQAAADCVSGASCSASCFVVTPGVR